MKDLLNLFNQQRQTLDFDAIKPALSAGNKRSLLQQLANLGGQLERDRQADVEAQPAHALRRGRLVRPALVSTRGTTHAREPVPVEP